jgi:hypothetical protein
LHKNVVVSSSHRPVLNTYAIAPHSVTAILAAASSSLSPARMRTRDAAASARCTQSQ